MTALSFTGLVSGLDTESLVSELVRFNQRRIDLLQLRRTEAELDLALFDEVETRAAALQGQVVRLSRTNGSVFDARSVTSSDESVLTAAAGTGAQPGIHVLQVNQIARASQEASQAFNSSSDLIKRGTFNISAGGATANITIDASNDTLQGLAQAISSAGVGVSATIIDTGTNFRLLLTAENTGTDSAINITNNLNDGTQPGSVQPSFSTVQAAANSVLQIGSGAGAIQIQNQGNIVQGVLPGVTLNLVSAAPGQSVTLNVSNDTSAARDAIVGLVTDFNDLMQFIDEQSEFDPETGEAGPLLGDRSAISIQDSVRRSLLSVTPGLPSAFNRISVLGISVTSQGRLELDEGRLNAVLSGNVSGIEFDDVRRLFGFTGESTNPGVQFILGSDRTRDSATPIEVDLTQAAEQASITATNGIGPLVTITGANNQLTVQIDGQISSTISLPQGVFNPADLAEAVEGVINGDPQLNGRSISVTASGGQLSITSTRFGFDSEVASVTGSAAGTLGFNGTESDRGRDVVGRFIVDGNVETAIGRGQVLVGDSGNATTADLRVLVTLSPSQIQGGSEAELTVTRGVAARLQVTLSQILDPISGQLATIDEGIETRIEDADDAVERETEALADREAALFRQFAALERIIGQSQSLGELISNQLTPLLNRN